MRRLLSAIILLGCVNSAVSVAFAGTSTLRLSDVNIQLSTPDRGLPVHQRELEAWVRQSAQAVSNYYGRFPISALRVRIRIGSGSNIGGTAYGYNRSISIRLGRQVSVRDLAEDWVLVHEMLHMGHPNLSNRHKWFKEGLATYVEPIARARMGDMSVNKVWADFVRQLPQGQPRAGDSGLDFTPTWGRVYWGGALFFLLADVGIRRATGNRKGLEHALRAIVAAGGTLDSRWSITEALKVGDGAIGAPVLARLYSRMRDTPARIDLDNVWRRLGVERGVRGVTLRDNAPDALIRRAITGG